MFDGDPGDEHRSDREPEEGPVNLAGESTPIPDLDEEEVETADEDHDEDGTDGDGEVVGGGAGWGTRAPA